MWTKTQEKYYQGIKRKKPYISVYHTTHKDRLIQANLTDWGISNMPELSYPLKINSDFKKAFELKKQEFFQLSRKAGTF